MNTRADVVLKQTIVPVLKHEYGLTSDSGTVVQHNGTVLVNSMHRGHIVTGVLQTSVSVDKQRR